MKKILFPILFLISVGVYAQQQDSALLRAMKFSSLAKLCDSVRTLPGSIVITTIDKNYKQVKAVDIKAYSRSQVVMEAETDKNGYCTFIVSDPSRIDSVSGYKGNAYFKCVTSGGAVKAPKVTYILQAPHYDRDTEAVKPKGN